MATANAILLRQRQEKVLSEEHRRTNSEQQKRLWKRKTDILASKANMRYDQVTMTTEMAE